jgi:hypothetical protein
VVGVGLGTGLVAYYVGFPTSAFTARGGPEELRYLPSSATVVAYADVSDVMASELRRRFRETIMPGAQENGQHEFQELTGINFETDIERIVACFDSASSPSGNSALIFARGTFDNTKIEALMRAHGALVQDYKGKRLIVAQHFGPDHFDANSLGDTSENQDAQPAPGRLPRHRVEQEMALTFMEPGLAVFGGQSLVKQAIDLHTSGGSSAATNDELVEHIRTQQGGNAWVVGRLDAIRARAQLPEIVANQIPPITWFAIRGRVDGGVQALITAEGKDDEAANMLRDVVRGFLALAKLQTSNKPEFKRFVDSLQLGGSGKTVSLGVDVPAQLFDMLAALPKTQKQ